MRALLFVNRFARRGTAALDDVRSVLRRGGIDVTELPFDSSRPLCAMLREHGPGYDAVIIGGGDGTINAGLPALLEIGRPLGILPLGTGNDLARTLGIEPDPVAAAGLIVAGHRRWVDVGAVNGHFFFNVASIGFSAELARQLTAEAKRRWGVLGYAFTAARLLADMRPFHAWIDHDSRVEEITTVQISVGSGRHHGGGMTVADGAEPDDGHLDVYSVEIDHWWQLLALAPGLRRGLRRRNVRRFRTTEFRVRTDKRRSINADGELRTHTPAHFRIIRARSRFSPRAASSSDAPAPRTCGRPSRPERTWRELDERR